MNRKYWAVVWTEDGAKEYGVPHKDIIISVEPREVIKIDVRKNKKVGRPAIRYTEPLAIFTARRDALAYRDANKDWAIVSCAIQIPR